MNYMSMKMQIKIYHWPMITIHVTIKDLIVLKRGSWRMANDLLSHIYWKIEILFQEILESNIKEDESIF